MTASTMMNNMMCMPMGMMMPGVSSPSSVAASRMI